MTQADEGPRPLTSEVVAAAGAVAQAIVPEPGPTVPVSSRHSEVTTLRFSRTGALMAATPAARWLLLRRWLADASALPDTGSARAAVLQVYRC